MSDSTSSVPSSRFWRGVKLTFLLLLLAWLSLAFWNSAKPLPPGTHIVSQIVRLSEADVEFAYQPRLGIGPSRDVAAIDHAEHLIVIDRSPVTDSLVRRVLARKRARPNIQVVIVTDPGNEAFGGTPARTLQLLEQAGIIVARVRLERLRDSNPLYSGLWRMLFGWWSDPFDEPRGQVTPRTWSRMQNLKSDERQLVITDDGAGGWIAVAAAGASATLTLRGPLARAMIAAELQIAAWSTDDDRLPAAPPIESRGVGSIDARFLTEGAIEAALLDAIAAAGSGDQVLVAADNLADRPLVATILLAAARGARLQVLLARNRMPNQAVAGELLGNGSRRIEVRWLSGGEAAPHPKLLVVQHRADVWMNLGAANFTRRSIGDVNLAASVELRMPARAAAARAVIDYFAKSWASASAEANFDDRSTDLYWLYRIAEATGLSSF